MHEFIHFPPGGEPVRPVSKAAQAVLEILTDGLGGPNDIHRRYDNAPGAFMAVTVERVGANLYSVAHYFELNGDLMRDPEVVFWRHPDDGRFFPAEYTQDNIGLHQQLVEFDDAGEPVRYMRRYQASCASFCTTWMANIRRQQGLRKPPRRSTIPPAPATVEGGAA